jgi:hypothetical protein
LGNTSNNERNIPIRIYCTDIFYDKDASTMKNVLQIFQDVQKSLL